MLQMVSNGTMKALRVAANPLLVEWTEYLPCAGACVYVMCKKWLNTDLTEPKGGS